MAHKHHHHDHMTYGTDLDEYEAWIESQPDKKAARLAAGIAEWVSIQPGQPERRIS